MSGPTTQEDANSMLFKETPSGNLKVHRKHVIFQCKTLGIVAVDPGITTVEVRKVSEVDKGTVTEKDEVIRNVAESSYSPHGSNSLSNNVLQINEHRSDTKRNNTVPENQETKVSTEDGRHDYDKSNNTEVNLRQEQEESKTPDIDNRNSPKTGKDTQWIKEFKVNDDFSNNSRQGGKKIVKHSLGHEHSTKDGSNRNVKSGHNTTTSGSGYDDFSTGENERKPCQLALKALDGEVHGIKSRVIRSKNKPQRSGKDHTLMDLRGNGSPGKIMKFASAPKAKISRHFLKCSELSMTGSKGRGNSTKLLPPDFRVNLSPEVKRRSRTCPRNSGIPTLTSQINETREVIRNSGSEKKCINVRRQRGGASSSRILADPCTETKLISQKPNDTPEKTSALEERHGVENCFLLSHIDWRKVPLPAKTSVWVQVSKMLSWNKEPDCEVFINQKEFRCHKFLLVCYSGYFAKLNSKKTYQYDLSKTEVQPNIFSLIYKWMMCNKGEAWKLLRPSNVLELLLSAQALEISWLEDQCWALIFNEAVFTEANALQLGLQAQHFKNSQVLDLMEPRIVNSFLPLVSTSDWERLPVTLVTRLLSSNYIAVHCEMEVFMSAVKWLMHNFNSRNKLVVIVLSCVRFGLIAPWQIVDIRHNAGIPEYRAVVKFPEVLQMLDQGLSYGINRCRYGFNTPEYQKVTKNLGLKEPEARNWVGEYRIYRNYTDFLEMLESYRVTTLQRRKENLKSNTPSITTPQTW